MVGIVRTFLGISPLKPIMFYFAQLIYYVYYRYQIKMFRVKNLISYWASERKLLSSLGYLKIRNSQSIEIQIPMSEKKQTILINIPKSSTLKNLTQQLQSKINITNVQYLCNQKIQLPESTPLDILINRYFYITSNEYYMFSVEGQLFDYGKSEQVVEGIASLELPAITKKQVENYVGRINRWIQFYTGKTILEQAAKVDSKTATKLFVQAAIDPQPQERNILQVQRQWEQKYWQVAELRKKKMEADEICLKTVKRKMSWGLMFLGANIAFIWSGTYIFYSWDIIQPMAYFMSSLGGIILAAQFFRLGRPYSNTAYQEYLMDKIAPRIYKEVGFSMNDLTNAEFELIQLESILKDYYLKRL